MLLPTSRRGRHRKQSQRTDQIFHYQTRPLQSMKTHPKFQTSSDIQATRTFRGKGTMALATTLILTVLLGLSFPGSARGQPSPTTAAPTASPAPPPSAPAKKSATDLEKLAMPIALHPDALIAVILPASAYPLEIVQAARFVKDTNNIAKLDDQPWDENVKAVARFPDLIAKMDADLAWTTELGQAFLNQSKDLMDTIQSLRAKAHT